jgi:hypothetical protein
VPLNGVERIVVERKRQVKVEGWTAEHDSEHTDGELARAATCYALAEPDDKRLPADWPWDREWWKPSRKRDFAAARIRMLEKAGTLVAAEIDRLLGLEK